MRIRDYSEAVIALIEKGKASDEVIEGLARVLKARGHNRLYPAILRSVDRTLAAREERSSVTVTVGREGDRVKYDREIASALLNKGLQGTPRTVVDPRVIGGFSIKSNDIVYDRTFKHRLVALYRSIIQ